MDAMKPIQHPLHEKLRLSISIRWQQFVGLANGNAFRISVECRRGRKHKSAHAMREYRLQQRKRVRRVIAEELCRIAHRLAGLDPSGEMHNGIRLKLRECAVERGSITDVSHH